ncbi:ABC transporter substrate-binding protein [Demequina lignilytica]|uniref:ABC transporter substrate-binding protein n=1 Tax=Demequina lignilytica TaxID=3051663 RepID=A0AAW7MAI6_9MICO|nr:MULTISPECIES: ABC transporter substrate-binding protein [unclassified Demequina]MDN4478819.1 ABC transporter substrate-binding protein [Demequina sp. SYSU T00039-1]MDN4484082.1 ABC transporter substrate-binding protein [Demequina sp. SYSU T0a273]MDN4488917.1 ABC transporter substrate-binding protein [Demequina sp. SYSU T00039]MDN4490335.1 ABC transporter substrate-binding protein [Demequina sp. SYSU T00068]
MSFTFGRAGKRTAMVAAAAVASFALAACSSSSADVEASGVAAGESMEAEAPAYGDFTVQLSWIKNEEFSGEFFATENGYFTESGFDSVELVPGPSTGAAELVSNTVDVALSDAVSIGAAVANEGAPLKIIGATYQKNPFTVLSLADGGNILTAEDMVGKKIGVQDSNMSLFLALLAANGLTEDDVEIVPVQYDPAPLTNGEVDGFIAYLTNESITVSMAGYETANLPFADNGLPFVAETFTVTDESIADNRDALKAFLVAEIKGWADAVNDPAEGARLAYEVYGVDLGLDPEASEAGAIMQAEELVVSDETVANGLFTISDELQSETIASLAGAGIEIEAADLFDLSILAEVYAENPDLVAYAG